MRSSWCLTQNILLMVYRCLWINDSIIKYWWNISPASGSIKIQIDIKKPWNLFPVQTTLWTNRVFKGEFTKREGVGVHCFLNKKIIGDTSAHSTQITEVFYRTFNNVKTLDCRPSVGYQKCADKCRTVGVSICDSSTVITIIQRNPYTPIFGLYFRNLVGLESGATAWKWKLDSRHVDMLNNLK